MKLWKLESIFEIDREYFNVKHPGAPSFPTARIRLWNILETDPKLPKFEHIQTSSNVPCQRFWMPYTIQSSHSPVLFSIKE
jgi:hypothetical protein